MGGSAAGGVTARGGGLQMGGGATPLTAFAMQLMQMQQFAMQQAQMQEMMRRQMMSAGAEGCRMMQDAAASTTRIGTVSPGAPNSTTVVPPRRPLTEVQLRRIAREEVRQREIQQRIAERERQTAERIAAHEQHLADLRARYAAD